MNKNIVFVFISAFALNCWQCNGKEDANCNDPFDAGKLDKAISFVDCLPETPNDQAFCVKASSKVHFVLLILM